MHPPNPTQELRNPAQDYVLGNGAQEQNRLKLQAGILEKWTEGFFRAAGIAPGMRVLDLGCGMGDVSLLAARLVGPTGSVVGIDRDEVIVRKARERVDGEGRCANIEVICSDVLEFDAPSRFDAVVGRYILLYQPDPVNAVRHAAKQVCSGGIVVFHEMDFANPIRSYPDGTLFGELMYGLITDTFRRAGSHADLGLHLTRIFREAGLPWPTITAEVPIGGEPGCFLYTWLAETLRSLLPRIEQFNLASADELDLDTLVVRMETEAVANHCQLIGPLQFGAWSRKPECGAPC
jgi:ubiquinone/menaquinone biosynthesis C-methylase UbiE